MNHLVVFIILGIITYFAFKFSVILGIVVIGLIAFMLYKLNYAAFLEMRANAEMQQKNFESALKLYEKAYESKDRKFSVDISYSRALSRTGNSEKALEILNNILGLNLKREVKVVAKETRCLVNYKLGKLDEAYEEAYELFYESNHTTSTMHALLGLLMLEKNGVTKETTNFCEKAYEYDSDSRDIVDNLAVCCYSNGDYKRGFELCEALTDEHPKFVEGWYHGSQMLDKLGDRKKALEYARKALEGDRNSMTTVSEEDIKALIRKLS